MPDRPHITVAAVVERDGRFLMVEERIDGQRVYNQPAGHLENNESLVQAVIRETLEETAWEVRPDHLVGLYRWTRPHDQLTYLRACFSCSCLSHYPERALDEGIERAVWLSPQEISALGPQLRSPMVLKCLANYLSGQRFPLTLLQDIDGI